MTKNSKIYVAGHRGLLGSALVRRLRAEGLNNLIFQTHAECDLTNITSVKRLFSSQRPEYVFLAAARVGGVCSNRNHEADFLLDNLRIQNNVIECAHLYSVKKLLFMGSACVYPKHAPTPVKEDSLLTGPLEESNQWYALAKIAGLKLCQAYRRQHDCDFISCMPTNLYGPGDHYGYTSSHVLPAMLRRFHDAKILRSNFVKCWGTGNPTREFLYSDDCADACIVLMQKYSSASPVNISSGYPVSIARLAFECADAAGYTGVIDWDASKPDGTPNRAMDVSMMKGFGWAPKYSLATGLRNTYADFLSTKLSAHADKIYDSHR